MHKFVYLFSFSIQLNCFNDESYLVDVDNDEVVEFSLFI